MAYFLNFTKSFRFNHWKAFGNLAAAEIHPHYELCLFLTPEPSNLILNGQSFTFTGPFAHISAPFCIHEVNFLTWDHEIERIVYYFGEDMIKNNPQTLSPLLKELNFSSCIYHLSPDIVPTLRYLVDLTERFDRDHVIQKTVFLTIFALIANADCPKDIVGSKASEPQICGIIRYLCQHFHENITAEDVAKEFFISRSKLDKDFQKYIGASFRKILNEIRLSHAVFLLRNTDLKISVIADECGFENENYFFIRFKEYKGVTPLKYRAKHRHKRKSINTAPQPESFEI